MWVGDRIRLAMSLPFVDLSAYLYLLNSVNPSVLQGIFIALGIFFMALLIGLSRRYIASSSLQGLWAGVATGIIAILAIETGVVWGLRNFMNGERANLLPKNVRTLISAGQENLTQVLGTQTEKERPTAQTVISDYRTLSPLDTELAKGFVCKESKKSE